MGIELDTSKAICCKCGRAYGKRKGNFPPSYGTLYKGSGYIPICKDCIDSMYNVYLAQCNDSAAAVRQVCRCLDLYWSQRAYDASSAKSSNRSIMSGYLTKINTITYSGKCYDDTLTEEGTLWSQIIQNDIIDEVDQESQQDSSEAIEQTYDIPDEVKEYWGDGYDDKDYYILERRRKNLLAGFPQGTKITVSTEGYIKQICALERDAENARVAGKPVDRLVATLDKLYGSLGIKPSQMQDDGLDATMAETPMGVWLYRFENKRPLPDKYSESKILKYIFTWMGHVLKMMGKKNRYEQLYQEEIDRLRVEKPEYDGSDEDLMMDYFAEEGDNPDG